MRGTNVSVSHPGPPWLPAGGVLLVRPLAWAAPDSRGLATTTMMVAGRMAERTQPLDSGEAIRH